MLVQDVPVTATRQVTADSVDGDTMVVTRTLERSIGGTEEPAQELRYAVDRETAESVAPPDDAEGVLDSEGLVFTLPIDPSTDDGEYTLWDQTTETANPLEYAGTETLEGRTVREFRSTAAGPVADPEALGLPTALPRAALAALGPALADLVPPQVAAQLPAILPQLPAQIPLSYDSRTEATLFADAELGATISGASTQEITARLALGPTELEVPFSTVELASTDRSISDRASDTADSATQLTLIGTVAPLVALGLGLLLLVLAAFLARRAATRRGSTPPPAATPASRPRQRV
ncbi:hypothetical protein DQ241_01435 [Blastococcus sp. TF02A-30]|nr:hypothetical protein DQ241_01435 [Blastococcus sp. TF02A-30]